MIDPKLNKCTYCTWTFKITMLQRIIMLLFGDIVIRCPKCQTEMTFTLIHHSVKVKSVMNKNRERIWKNG